jgi:serine/threonine protein kinase
MDDDNDSTTYTNAVDIWSFGCVVYQMLAHEVPFKNFPRQLVAFCRGAPFPESLLSKRVTQEAIEFVKSTLIPLPQSRPSAKQVMQAIWLKTEESQKELDTWNRTLEYLQPGFNLSSLTATRLRYILLCNNIPHSPGAEKPELVEIVSRMVLPRTSQIRSSHKTANLSESGRVKSAERVAAMQRQLALEAQENGMTVPQFVLKMKAQDVAQKQAMQQQQQAAQQQQQRGHSHQKPRPILALSKNHARVAPNHSDALHKQTSGPAQATITSKATFNYPDSVTQWTMERVLLWLVENNFSREWQETFKALNIHGSQLLSLGSDNSVMYTVIYARLEQEYSYSGKKWAQARWREEGNRLRQLIGFLARAQNPTTSTSRHQLEHLDSDLGKSTSERTIQSTETAISELEISTHSGSILDDIFHIPTSAAPYDELLPGLKDLGEPRKHDISTARDTMSTAAPTYPPSRTSSPGVHRDESTTSRPLPAYESPYITNRYENFPASQASSSSFIDRIPNFFNRTKGKMVPLDKHGNRMR